jgi:uridine kinase
MKFKAERWIYAPLNTAVTFFYIILAINYIDLCAVDAFINANNIIPFYIGHGHSLIWLFSFLVNIIIIPFKSWGLFIICIINCAIVIPPLGIIYGLIIHPKSKNKYIDLPSIFLYICFLLVTSFYWYSIINNRVETLLVVYIYKSTFLFISSISGIFIWLFSIALLNLKRRTKIPNAMYSIEELDEKSLTSEQAIDYSSKWIKNQNGENALIVIAGPSCSGKSTLADKLRIKEMFSAVIIQADDYFRDVDDPAIPRSDNKPLFDHPGAYCQEEMLKDIVDLVIYSKSISTPKYDIATNKRMKGKIIVTPHKVVIFEGLFAISEIMNIRDRFKALLFVYVDADYDIRLKRRTDRDEEFIHDTELIEKLFKEVAEKSYEEYGNSQINSADLIVYS